ncbi:hypothetical protein WMF04_17010 [Sorangium sp. So ce260]|uniref:hypothetical protein n=1 Tax=Sorangium sp. So ce260 TaxID=3133291 RepID=UPI003F606904
MLVQLQEIEHFPSPFTIFSVRDLVRGRRASSGFVSSDLVISSPDSGFPIPFPIAIAASLSAWPSRGMSASCLVSYGAAARNRTTSYARGCVGAFAVARCAMLAMTHLHVTLDVHRVIPRRRA